MTVKTYAANEADAQRNRLVWMQNIDEEVSYWRDVLDGKERLSGEINWRLDPATELDNVHQQALGPMDAGQTPNVLDVGAGPLTPVGKSLNGRRIRLVAVDPLADAYNELLDERKIIPTIRTRFAEGERLQDRFPPDSFDLVTSSNSIDHSYDPLSYVDSMLSVVKPGKNVLVIGCVNEGQHAQYHGLHQWNMDASQGRLEFWQPQGQRMAVAEVLKDKVASEQMIFPHPYGDRWFASILKKRG